MTKEQKQVLKAIGGIVLVKIAIYSSIAYAARALRKANENIDPDGSFQGYFISRKTGAIGTHASTDDL